MGRGQMRFLHGCSSPRWVIPDVYHVVTPNNGVEQHIKIEYGKLGKSGSHMDHLGGHKNEIFTVGF